MLFECVFDTKTTRWAPHDSCSHKSHHVYMERGAAIIRPPSGHQWGAKSHQGGTKSDFATPLMMIVCRRGVHFTCEHNMWEDGTSSMANIHPRAITFWSERAPLMCNIRGGTQRVGGWSLSDAIHSISGALCVPFCTRRINHNRYQRRRECCWVQLVREYAGNCIIGCRRVENSIEI